MPNIDAWVLIDTSAWIHALRPDGLPVIRKQVRETLEQGRAAICPMVMLELLSGTRTQHEYQELYGDLMALKQFPINEMVWEHAYSTTHALRRKGISIPATDQLIASTAFVFSSAILHDDKHFELLAKHVQINLFQ